MKKGNMLVLIFTVAMLCVCIAMPVWAFKITVTSELSQDDGKVYTSVRWGLLSKVHNFNDGHGISPGQTVTFSNEDWKNKGLCWDDVSVKPQTQWSGCPAPQWKDRTVTQCRDIKVILKRSGCTVEPFVY